MTRTWTLRQHSTSLAVCRLAPDAEVPTWVGTAAPLTAVVRTATELSVLTAADAVPDDLPALGPYVGFEVAQVLDAGLVGVLAELLEPLVEQGISVLTLSTHDTDWVLVPLNRAEAAATAWRRRSLVVLDPVAT